MTETQKLRRSYASSDATMQQRMRTMRDHFAQRRAKFEQLNPEFGGTFLADWEAAQRTAEQATSAAVRTGTLKEKTGDVNAAADDNRLLLKQLFYAVRRAFPGNEGRLQQYGYAKFEAARDDHDELVALLHQAVDAATRDQAELAKKGFGPAQLQELADDLAAVTDANTDQETQKGVNVEVGQDYIRKQNALYGFGQRASEAAKLVYDDDPAARQLFHLTDGAAPAEAVPPTAPK